MNLAPPAASPGQRQLTLYVWLAAALWVVAVSTSFFWYWSSECDKTTAMARMQAHVAFEKDALLRQWINTHGGVYVAVTSETRPNPALDITERDITTPSGVQLTRRNSYAVMGELSALAGRQSAAMGRFFGSKPLNPANLPDAWEAEALKRFAEGEAEVASIADLGGVPHMRMAHPFVAQEKCLNCHASRGIKDGDIIGGLGEVVPMASFLAAERQEVAQRAWRYSLLGLLGLAGIWVGARRLLRSERDRASVEQELRASEANYRGLFDSSRDAIMTLEPPLWKFASGNPATVAMFGAMDEEHFVTMGPWELSTAQQPDGSASSEKAKEMIEIAMREGSHFFEWTHRRINGEAFPATVLLSRMEANGRTFLQATVRDITEQKRQEEERGRMLAILDESTDFIGIADMQGNLKYHNPAAKKLVGLPVGADLAHLKIRDIHPGWAAKLVEEDGIPTVLKTGSWRRENAVLHRNGTEIPVSQVLVVHRDSSGKPQFLSTIMRDITAQKLAEAELQKLSRAVEQSPASIVITDPQGIIEYVNPKFTAVTGYTAQEALGKNSRILKSGELPAALYTELWTTITAGREWRGEFHNKKKNGESFWEAASISPIIDKAGTLIHFVAVKEDITARKRTEAELLAAKAAAENANRAKSTFLANMSHELRTPLNAIIGFSGILRKNKAGNLRQNDLMYLERVEDNGKHLLELINSILDLSKIEAGKVEVETGSVDLAALVRDTLAQLEGAVRNRDVKLLAEIPACVAPLATDGPKLKQVIINLVANALKFTERGSVTLRVVTDGAGQPQRLEVVDTGIGIPRNKLDVIFEAFQQAENSTARKYGGTGLGLTISRSLCKLMGYHLAVASTVGHGSTFSVCFNPASVSAFRRAVKLPDAVPVRAAPSTPSASARRPDLRGKLVLVIDDDADSLLVLSRHLEDLGCRVIAASTGRDGLDLARSRHPDLITLDYRMPRMNGWAVLRELKHDPQLREIPVIVVSAVADQQRGVLPGAVDFLTKPVSRDDLLQVLSRTLRVPRGSVLVVDDDEDARRLLLAHLSEEGFDTRTAVNGREALQVLESAPVDLVILDLLMPVMDGESFLAAIRRDPRFAQMPVVIVTNKDLLRADEERLKAHSSGVLGKTDAWDKELARTVRNILHT
ncbi:MAG TPA: PAS domain S-box protein [Planctomycetota bacterium]|jgi:PAS domain S-box-containing protein